MNFDWNIWGTPLMVLVAGAAIGALLLRNREGDKAAIEAEGVRRDLEREHQSALEALRMLETEKDKMQPDAYESERKALLARGAAALREMEGGESSGSTSEGAAPHLDALVQTLRAERERVGTDAFDAALRVATGAGAPVAEPDGVAPAWRGAITASAVWALVAMLLMFAGDNSTERGDGSMTGGTTMGRGEQPPPPHPVGGPVPASQPSFDAMAAPLEERVKANPKDIEALNELTQLALSAGDAQRAMQYNQAASEIDPDDPDVGASKAVLAAMVGLVPRAMELLDGVLETHPDHARTVTYKGLLYMEDGKPQEAIPWLEKAVALQPGVVPLQQALDAARRGEGLPSAGGPPPSQAPAQHPGAAPSGPGEVVISGKLELGPGAKTDGAQLLFISVRAPEGGPPLAAKRLPASGFPLEFAITTADAISMGGAPRPFPAQMSITARLDGDGNAMTREDLASAGAGGVAKGTTGLSLTLE